MFSNGFDKTAGLKESATKAMKSGAATVAKSLKSGANTAKKVIKKHPYATAGVAGAVGFGAGMKASGSKD